MKTCLFWRLQLSALLLSHQADGLSFFPEAKNVEGTNTPCNVGPDAMTINNAPNTEGLPIPQFCIKNPVTNGKPRCYYLFVPKCASGKVPLVVNMQDSESCPVWGSYYDRWIQTAVSHCFAVAFPVGVTDPEVSDNTCMTFAGGRSVDDGLFTTNDCCCRKDGRSLESSETLDMIFIRNVVQDIGFEKRVDALSSISNGNAELDGTRIYMTGHSNGCIAALAMGALYSNLVAAVACHSAGSVGDFPSYYDPVPTMLFQGMKDDIMWYQFAGDTARNIATVHDCKNDSETLLQNATGVEYAFQDCKNNASVKLVVLNESGHFPFLKSIELTKGASVTTVDTTEMAWEFCSNYSKSEMPVALLLASSAVGSSSIFWSSGGVAVGVMMFASMMFC
jgi:poly(3-hydroxybutyrate) depolymerase